MKTMMRLMALFTTLLVSSGSMASTTNDVTLVQVKTKDERLIEAPKHAVVYRNGIPGVFVLQNGEARFRMVRTGKQTKKTITVLSGLFGNETLVLADPEQLYDGMPIHTDNHTDRNASRP